MAVIKLNNLGGISPSTLPRNLPANSAQTANNLQPNTTEFRPLASDLVVATVPDTNPRSLYRFARNADGTLITSPTAGWRSHALGVTVAKSQLNDDRTERTYFTFDDGSAPPREFDNQGGARQLGIPAPTVKPTVTAVDVYAFTEDRKSAEIKVAVQSAVSKVELNAVSALVGLGSAFAAPGWLLESSFSTRPDADRHVVRVFALNPTTNQIIATYSAMPPSEASWIFDPSLGGDYATAPAGFVTPAWATGHTKWWRIRLRAFAKAYDVVEPTLSTALQAIDMPGTQGAKKYLTATEANLVANNIAKQFDKDAGRVGTLVNVLNACQAEAASAFNQGGAVGITQSVAAFYARSDIASSIDASTNAFAENIWRYITMLGTATAQPFYVDENRTSGVN